MTCNKGWLVVGFFFLNGIVFADEVTELLTKASTYEAQSSVQYDSVETYQRGKLINKSSYLGFKKGKKELKQSDTGDLELVEPDQKTTMVGGVAKTNSAVPNVFDYLLKEYRANRIQAKVVSKKDSWILKGTQGKIEFEAEFLKTPVLLLRCESKDETGRKIFEGTWEYNLTMEPPQLLKVTYMGDTSENGKLAERYKKTVEYRASISDPETSEDIVSIQTLQNRSALEGRFKKLKKNLGVGGLD